MSPGQETDMLGKSLITSYAHPALAQLLLFQLRGKFARACNGFRSKRRLALSILAVVLAFVWLGQTVLSIMLREPADPQSLKTWLSVSLLLYSVFHLIKIGCRKPVEPFEWNAAEKQNLLSAPLTRKQLLTYRFVSYLSATAAKAACFSIVMIPDLPSVVVGYTGMFLGLTLVDLIRVFLESLAWTASETGKRHWLIVRAAMLLPAFALLGFTFFQTAYSPQFESAVSSHNPLSIPKLFLGVVEQVVQHPMIAWTMVPWNAVVETILATEYGVGFFVRTGLLYVAVVALFAAVYFVDQKSELWLKKVATFKATTKSDLVKDSSQERKQVEAPVGYGGVKAIVWYQALGAMHYRSTLLLALAIPTVLSCLPLLSGGRGIGTSLSVLGSMIFYSFLLLPPALMLDFRRDARRLSVWKSTPILSFNLTMGQLAIPVALMSLFQLCVLAVAVLGAGLSWQMIFAWPLLIPMNVLIIGMENAIFLMHPYRRNQEGIEVFLRTILTFTGKGLLFAVGLVAVMIWALASIAISRAVSDLGFAGPLLFGVGVWVALVSMAYASIRFCARLFDRLDVSQDLPAA